MAGRVDEVHSAIERAIAAFCALAALMRAFLRKCVTMCHMKRTTVRELHLQTSAIVKAVLAGESYIVEKSGVPAAELGPLSQPSGKRRMLNREAILSKMPRVPDSGRILEEDRS